MFTLENRIDRTLAKLGTTNDLTRYEIPSSGYVTIHILDAQRAITSYYDKGSNIRFNETPYGNKSRIEICFLDLEPVLVARRSWWNGDVKYETAVCEPDGKCAEYVIYNPDGKCHAVYEGCLPKAQNLPTRISEYSMDTRWVRMLGSAGSCQLGYIFSDKGSVDNVSLPSELLSVLQRSSENEKGWSLAKRVADVVLKSGTIRKEAQSGPQEVFLTHSSSHNVFEASRRLSENTAAEYQRFAQYSALILT